MSLERNKKTAIRFLEASAIHDPQVISSLLTDDAEYWVQGVPRLFKHAGSQSKEKICAYMETPSVFTRKLEQRFGNVTAEENRVSVEVELEGMTEDGRSYQNTYHYLFLFDDERISCVKEYLDTAVAAEMFG